MDYLEEELRHNDAENFAGRLMRFKEIQAWFQIPECGLSATPDAESVIALQDARFAYVEGFWIAAILTSLVSVERDLAWRLTRAGEKDVERMTAQHILGRSKSLGFITEDQIKEIDQIRKYRNSYAHFQAESRYQMILGDLVDKMNERPDDEALDEVNVNFVLHDEARTAVKFACSYFLQAPSWN